MLDDESTNTGVHSTNNEGTIPMPISRMMIENDIGPLQQNQNHHAEMIMSFGQLYRESKKIRPMTCAPHKVSMQSTYFAS